MRISRNRFFTFIAILLVLVAASVLAGGATLPAKIVSVMSSLATAL